VTPTLENFRVRTSGRRGPNPLKPRNPSLAHEPHPQHRKLQFLAQTGPGADHPVMSNCPESRYLKVIWARVW
jgi:hypothetical protein